MFNAILIVAVSILLGVLVAALFLRLNREIGSARAALPVTADWIDELSMERYRPMMRLLDAEDLAVLRSHPAFTPHLANRVRAQRAEIFRGYLRCLHNDFRRVSMAIRILMVQSRDDRPDLAAMLIRRRILFTLGMAVIHVRLTLYRFGLSRVDVTGVMKTFDAMRLELRTLLPAPFTLNA